MSDDNRTPAPVPAQAPGASAEPAGPRPEPIRFFGTTWVDHTGNYAARRAGLAVGSLAAAIVACLVLRFAYQGLQIADVGSFVTILVVVMFAVCSALAFRNTWDAFDRRPDPDRQASLRGLLAIGFVGSLLAYCFRCLREAPGEKLHRAEYEEARARRARRSGRRSGHPAKRKRPTP
ncbi:EamA/RhaT family transporter [Streptomyces sp. NPDC090306]|uniref:EamA/RhaT family transporter n=1 Tax=unclassified Streptomyces TaxID=2593676 RepID=UPI0036E8B63D